MGYFRTPNGLTERDFTFENSLDLAPADALFAQAIEEEIAQLKPDQPLVILSGEDHTHPTDIMCHIGGISHLLKMQLEQSHDPNRDFLVAHEREFNLSYGIAKDLGLNVPDGLKYKSDELDPDNKLILVFCALNITSLFSPYSSSLFFKFIGQHSIPLIFNDAARYEIGKETFLCPDAPCFKHALETYNKENKAISLGDQNNINAAASTGIAIRNMVMVEKALQRAKETQTRIIFQQCGNVHVLGSKHHNSKVEHSLSFLYREAGARVLPVVCRPAEEERFKEFPNTLIRRGLNQKSFQSPTTTINRVDVDKERLYLGTLSAHYGTNGCPFYDDEFLINPDINEYIKIALEQNIRLYEENNIQKQKRPNFFQHLFLGR